MLFSRKIVVAVGIWVALVLAPTVLSGCEFGNEESTSLGGYDTISGYYITLPQSIDFHAQVGSDPIRSKSGMVAEMPDLLKQVMSNPTALVFDDPLQGLGSIRSREQMGIGFYTLIQAQAGTLGASDEVYADVNGCRFSKVVNTSGSFSQLPAQQKVSDVWARGKIALVYDVTFQTTGEDEDCAPIREQFESCFIDGIGCSSDPRDLFYIGLVDEIFTPFVDAGLIKPGEISTTKSLRYRASYE